MVKTEKEVQKQVIETFKSMGYAYLGDLTKSDNENINKESLKAWLVKNQKINDKRWQRIEHKINNTLKNDLYEANQKFYKLLIYGVKNKISQNEPTQTSWLIDWKDVFKNISFLEQLFKLIEALKKNVEECKKVSLELLLQIYKEQKSETEFNAISKVLNALNEKQSITESKKDNA